MTDLDVNNWLTYISICIALIGGVPGVIAILREQKARPKIAAYLHTISPLSMKDTQGQEHVGLILDITIGNQGREAIVPLALQLECKINGKWLQFSSGRIPEGYTVTGPTGEYQINNVRETDLNQRKHAITRESPAHGYLLFIAKDISMSELTAIFLQMPKKLRCIDLFMKTHELTLNQDLIVTSHDN